MEYLRLNEIINIFTIWSAVSVFDFIFSIESARKPEHSAIKIKYENGRFSWVNKTSRLAVNKRKKMIS